MILTQLVQVVVDLGLPRPGSVATAVAGSAGLFAGGLLSFVLAALLNGLLLVVLSRAVVGQRVDAAAAWRSVAPRLAGLIGLTLLVALVIGGIVLVAVLPGLVAGATGSTGAIMLMLALLLVAVVAVVALAVYWAFAAAVYVLEPVGVLAALRRSAQLVHGAWWRIFGILLLGSLLVGVVAIAVVGVIGGFTLEPDTTGWIVRTSIGTVLVGTLATPFSTGVVGLLYLDQRIRRERLDIALAQSAAGAQPPQSFPPR
jgi:hypothetical protein